MQELKGSFVALVTPMKSNGEIDFPALKELVEWHIESGTHGLVSVGTTGESATLNFNDHVTIRSIQPSENRVELHSEVNWGIMTEGILLFDKDGKRL